MLDILKITKQSLGRVLRQLIAQARIEILDAAMMDAVNRYSKLDYPRQPTLFFEFHGTEAEVADQSKSFGEIAKECGGGDFSWTTKPEDRTRLWQARHDAFWATKNMMPMQPGDVPATFADVEDLARDVDFAPRTPIEVGVPRFVEWYRAYYGG